MSNNNTPTFKISALNPELFSLGNVALNPRSLSPLDLTSASKNLAVDFDSLNPSNHVESFVKYLFLDFFVSAHSTGLYNRQNDLWASVSKIVAGKFEPVMSGWIFSKKETPVIEISFLDNLGRPIIIAWLVTELGNDDQFGELSGYLNTYVKTLNKIRLSENNLKGAFFGANGPIIEPLIDKFKKLVNANDPIAKYESRLPEPASIPLNLIEFVENSPIDEQSETESVSENEEQQKELPWILQPSSLQVNLIHPFLPVRNNSKVKK